MECLLIFFVLLITFTLVIRSSAGNDSRSTRKRNYQHLAREFSGVYLSGGLFRAPKVRFRYGETTAFLTESPSRGSGRATQIQINWPDARLRAEIRRDDHATLPDDLRGMSELTSGHSEFDRQFFIRGEDKEEVRHLLTDGVRWQIERLSKLFGDDQLCILFNHGRIHIKKRRILRKYEDLREFLQRSVELYDQAMITRAVGIKFVEDGKAQTLDNVICSVCGDKIETDMVYCKRCKTPHHRECWNYAGACSVYGCREKNYSRPRLAKSINKPHTQEPQLSEQPEPTEGFHS